MLDKYNECVSCNKLERMRIAYQKKKKLKQNQK